MLKNTVTEEFESAIDSFADEVDCAILCDPKFEDSLAEMEASLPTAQEELDDDDMVDVNVDYTGSVPGADIVDMDADDIIATERDIMHNPFEDEDIVDAAVGEDFEIEDDDDIIDDEI